MPSFDFTEIFLQNWPIFSRLFTHFMQSLTTKYFWSRKISQKIHILAHSGGCNMSKMIIWHIFSHSSILCTLLTEKKSFEYFALWLKTLHKLCQKSANIWSIFRDILKYEHWNFRPPLNTHRGLTYHSHNKFLDSCSFTSNWRLKFWWWNFEANINLTSRFRSSVEFDTPYLAHEKSHNFPKTFIENFTIF